MTAWNALQFSLTSSTQFLYFSVIGICSSIAEPWFVFQFPVIDLRLSLKSKKNKNKCQKITANYYMCIDHDSMSSIKEILFNKMSNSLSKPLSPFEICTCAGLSDLNTSYFKNNNYKKYLKCEMSKRQQLRLREGTHKKIIKIKNNYRLNSRS